MLVQDSGRHGHLADVMQQQAHAQRRRAGIDAVEAALAAIVVPAVAAMQGLARYVGGEAGVRPRPDAAELS